ncbi:hypothetical protein [Acinetobacter baumannii]|uniref:hypothetical protein n=1 Tax=Acinetobacter baumannii TaxID=470 RepID=UPI0025432345|nr:hypothetical protein [Acinetobacter baumannii]MDO7383176.1 hypothetical protein [Acinetobacter baumannii]WIH73272.1 hypothetical protein M2A29_11140 [Acinetobacter baumannii]HCA5144155.1 hypothetical protein [Acinetobacter baumannii]
MAFRANEIVIENRKNAERYLLSNLKDLSDKERGESHDYLKNLMDRMGPVVDAYPIWHPLLIDKTNWMFYRSPRKESGYLKTDHNVYFSNGFITCPYNGASNYGQDVIDAVNSLPIVNGIRITAKKLPVKLYNSDTTAILIECIWADAFDEEGYIKWKAIAPLLLDTALQLYRLGTESFSIDEMIDDYLLGKPCGKRSSLFVAQDTGLRIIKMWKSILDSQMI